MSHKWPWSSVRVIVGISSPSLPSSPFPSFLPCLPLSLPSSLACHFLPSLPESLAESSHTCLQIPGVLFLGRTMDTVIKLFQSYSTFTSLKWEQVILPLGLLWNLSKITCKVCTQWLSKWVVASASFLRLLSFHPVSQASVLFPVHFPLFHSWNGTRSSTLVPLMALQSIHCWALLQRKLDS